MHIDPCCGGGTGDDTLDDRPQGLTRRRMLVAAGAGAGALVLHGLPAGAQEAPLDDPDAPSDPMAGTFEGSLVGTGRDYGFLPPRPASERHERPMMFPILGRTTWSDTYLAPRGGGRRHEGQDLLAAKMAKLLAVTDGVIVELRHRSSGNSLYLRGDDGWYYCYLHINNDTPGTDDGANRFTQAFAPGMANGVRVRRGQHIAFVGDSGNAEGTAPHCHFEIRMPNAKWYNAAAVNAKYSLDAAQPAGDTSQVPPETFAPWNKADDLIRRQYTDLLGRTASAANLAHWSGQLNQGKVTPEAMMQTFLESEEADDKTHSVARLYQAFFLRNADIDGFQFWTERRRGGYSLSSIADSFAGSTEFVRRYGTLSNAAFVDQIYRNVLGRTPDRNGKAFWTSRLDGGGSRGDVMVQFSNSNEYRFTQWRRTQVIVAYGCMLRRMPTTEEINVWSSQFAKGGSTRDLLALLRTSDEYRFVVYVSR